MHLEQLSTILPGTVVLTPNQRLATFLSEQFDLQQVAQAKSYWESPTFLTIDRWLELCWEQCVHAGTVPPLSLLSDTQVHSLWEEIIRQSEQGTLLLNCAATASIAKIAWELHNAWLIKIDDAAFQLNDDTRIWRLWAKEFIRLLKQQHCIDTSQIINLLLPTINAGDKSAQSDINILTTTSLDKSKLSHQLHGTKQTNVLLCHKQLLLIGCTELTPQQRSLFTALKKQGCHIEEHTLTTQQSLCQRIALKETETEIRTMALWAKQILSTDPKATICCVVPQLQQLRNTVIQHFSEVLAPESLISGTELAQLPFNISAGRPLSGYPIIHTALHILSLGRGQLPITDLSVLLRSPFLGAADQEMCARAQCDATARKYAEHTLSLSTLVKTAKQTLGCDQLVRQLEAFNLLTTQNLEILNRLATQSSHKEHSKESSKNSDKQFDHSKVSFNLASNKSDKLAPSKWANYFSAQLTAMGWPGEHSLNSVEYQLVEQWQQLLLEFSRLDRFVKPMTFLDAFAQLQSLANQQIFQAQTTHAQIQILDVMEATGIVFDYLWVMGLNDTAWPVSISPNPFIPLRLQHALKMPHTSADQEWRFTQQLTTQFQHSATHVIFSYPQQENDRRLRPSPLIMQPTEITTSDLKAAADTSIAQSLLFSGKCEEFIDDQAPPLTATEKISGGSALFKLMAACPFRAFAQFRLGAEPLATAITGLPAVELGKLVHHILEHFWKMVKTHENLCRYTDDQLNLLINSTVTHALNVLQKAHAITLRPRFFSIEQRRLVELMTRWLAWEKTRTPFTVIATEQRFNIKMGLLDIKLQADRIDLLNSEQSDLSHETNSQRLTDLQQKSDLVQRDLQQVTNSQQHSSSLPQTELLSQINSLAHYAIIDYKTSKISIQDWFGDRPDEPQLPLYCVASAIPINTLAFAQIRSDELACRAFGDTSLNIQDRSTKLVTDEEWQLHKQQWQKVLEHLSDDFQQGVAQVDPKNGQQTCQYCHLKTFCRIHERK